MKRNPIKELRWLISETLIYWALNIAPDDNGRIELARFLSIWLPKQMMRAKKVRAKAEDSKRIGC